eukprot:m.40247 g.40247  ORF g.40247 m.40247 type:complete len:315 (+) comp32931_c0_seq1:47-991(+)
MLRVRQLEFVLPIRLSRFSRPQSSGESYMNVFDRRTKRKQKNRAAAAADATTYDYLKDEVAFRLADRLRDVSRSFPICLDLGCGRGHVSKFVDSDSIGVFIQSDIAEEALKHAHSPTNRVHADEEILPFARDSFDLITSSLSLHWVNNLPGTFSQIWNCLRSDGVFIGALFATDTLFELRCSLQLAEEAHGGIAAHVSPFTNMQDVGSLLTQAGFTLTTIDVEEIVVNYPSMFELMKDLQKMGESNAAWTRRGYVSRAVLKEANLIYQSRYGSQDGSIPATYQVLHMIGWKPGKDQPQAAQRGSAAVSLKNVFE